MLNIYQELLEIGFHWIFIITPNSGAIMTMSTVWMKEIRIKDIM